MNQRLAVNADQFGLHRIGSALNASCRACRERAVKFALPPIETAVDIAAAMKAVTAALADGEITPGEAGRIAGVDTFVRAIVRVASRAFCRSSSSFSRSSKSLVSIGEFSLLICCRLENQ